MAGLLDTYLQDIRVATPNALDRNEWRMTRYGLVNSAVEQTASPLSIVTQEIKEKAMTSQGRLLKIPVMKKGALTVKNVRTCTIGEYENESALVDVTWATLAVDISMVKAQYAKNEIGYQQDLTAKLLLVKEAILGAIESAIYTKLDANKSLVFNSTLAGTKYPVVGDSLQVAVINQELFFNDVDAIQNADDFYSEHYIIGSTNLMPTVNHFINQGAGNDENLTYQFAGKSYRFSNSVIDAVTARSTGFMMPIGSLGMLSRVDVDSLMGNKANDGTEWGTVRIDGIPFDIGYMYKSKCDDKSLLNGVGMEHLTATMVEQWSFSVDFALLTPYNSDPVTKAGAIKKFEFLV